MRGRRRSPRVAVTVATLVLVGTFGGYVRPPAAMAATSPFTDIVGTTFEADIDWLYAEGITAGCSPTLYCPKNHVARDQMAAFLVRMFDLTEGAGIDAFSDDDGWTHEADINRLAYAGIAKGCAPTMFCPSQAMRRDDMASFIARAIPLTTGAGNNYFRDDDGTTHEANIDRLAAAGIITGCGQWRYCPTELVTRGQLAAYLRRIGTPLPPPAYPAPVGPLTLYVDTSGNDAGNACVVESDPCASVHRGIAMAAEGDTVQIGAGEFPVEHIRVQKDLTVRGSGTGTTTIVATGDSAVGSDAVLRIEGGARLDLRSLTITNAAANALYVTSHLVMTNVTLTGNRVRPAIQAEYGSLRVVDSRITDNAGFGLAIWGSKVTIVGSEISHNDRGGIGIVGPGTLAIHDSVISGNTGRAGAGVFIDQDYGGTLVTITDSTIADNRATEGRGGGIYVAGSGLRLRGSTVTGNQAAGDGGGIHIGQASSISNSTIVRNTGSRGGGIALVHEGQTTISNTTISENTAPSGGGIVTLDDAPEGFDPNYPSVTLKNAIVAGNSGPNITGPIAEAFASILGIPSGLTLADILDPGGLADNGGPTWTVALTDAIDNPAVGQGDGATCLGSAVSGLDQRGLPRTPPCDIGAYELQD